MGPETSFLSVVFGSLLPTLRRLNHLTLHWFARAWRTFRFTALIFSLVFSPETYRRDNRNAIAQQIVTGTGPNLIWFTVLCALVSLVLIRIVVVTALSYGLSKFALEMVVRVLVLELIPLTAAVFVALRCTLPDGVELGELRARGELDRLQKSGIDPIQREALPRVVAGTFTVLTLVAVSCITSLILAYITIYGFTPWGFSGYTRVVGQVLSPVVTLILVMKTLLFSFAVSLIPMASSLYDNLHMPVQGRTKAAGELASMVRLFSVVLLIEVASLMINYY